METYSRQRTPPPLYNTVAGIQSKNCVSYQLTGSYDIKFWKCWVYFTWESSGNVFSLPAHLSLKQHFSHGSLLFYVIDI